MTSLPAEARATAASKTSTTDVTPTMDAKREESPEAVVEHALGRNQLGLATELCAVHYGRCIGKLCMAMLGNQADAEELAQETLLSAHRAWASYRSDGSVKAWLLGIARKKCLKHLRQGKRRAELLHVVSSPPPTRAADERLIRQQQATEARTALEQIRPTEREAVLLRYVGELSFAELALASDVEAVTARKRVSRGLCKLRNLLNPTEPV